jgi:tRNA(fMet)-specific endonuclease VapC
MPATHLLDTSVFSQPIKPRPLPEVMQRWQALGDSALATSAICEAEILFGLRKKGSARLTASYETVLKGRFDILPVDSAVAAAYAELRADCEDRGSPVADMDLLIAATAKASNLIVATLNTNDFHAIHGVTVEDWSKPLPP